MNSRARLVHVPIDYIDPGRNVRVDLTGDGATFLDHENRFAMSPRLPDPRNLAQARLARPIRACRHRTPPAPPGHMSGPTPIYRHKRETPPDA